MNDPGHPEPVRRWAANPPGWLEVRDPKHIEDIPSLGRAGERGDGDRAVISLALEEHADFVLMDDNKTRRGKQVVAKSKEHALGMEPLWTLEVLDEAAERGLINDLPERLAVLEHQTPFYVGEKGPAGHRGDDTGETSSASRRPSRSPAAGKGGKGVAVRTRHPE